MRSLDAIITNAVLLGKEALFLIKRNVENILSKIL